MNKQPKSEWVYVGELAEYIDVNRKTIYQWIKDNRIPQPIRLGKMRWNRKTISDWLEHELNGNHHA
jgi:excisionase family DNA binding protein